jgi:hypothetical protein
LYDEGFRLIPLISYPVADVIIYVCLAIFCFRWFLINITVISKMMIYMMIVIIMRVTLYNVTVLPPILPCERVEADTPYRGNFIYVTYTCSDYIFSGHVSWMIFLSLLSIHQSSLVEKIFFILMTLSEIPLIIANRIHYTVDVCLAIIIAPLLFYSLKPHVDKLLNRKNISLP